jgi:hypothetical protein
MKTSLPKQAQEIINEYFNLKLNGKKVPCPYYINIRALRMGLRVLIGKGTPEEIIQESLIYEKLRGVDFNKMSVSEIREFMIKRHIGIDCSGFVIHVLDFHLRGKKKKHLWSYLKYPKQNLYRKIARFLRPVENISVEFLTSDLNSEQIENLNYIQPGDLIRLRGLKGGFHILLISEVLKHSGRVDSFKYVHATRWYNNAHGVREGEVQVKDANKSLSVQKWKDEYHGRNWTYEEVCKDPKYAQVRRLKNVPLY